MTEDRWQVMQDTQGGGHTVLGTLWAQERRLTGGPAVCVPPHSWAEAAWSPLLVLAEQVPPAPQGLRGGISRPGLHRGPRPHPAPPMSRLPLWGQACTSEGAGREPWPWAGSPVDHGPGHLMTDLAGCVRAIF